MIDVSIFLKNCIAFQMPSLKNSCLEVQFLYNYLLILLNLDQSWKLTQPY